MRDNDGNGSSVTATQLGRHLDLSRQRIRQLVDEHVIAQLPNGRFDQNDARIRYLRWLRDPERRSAKSEAERDFIRAKTELIDIRIREKRRDVMPTEMAIADMERLIDIVLTQMSGMGARIGGHDLQLRRRVDEIVYKTRVKLADTFNKLADEAREPPLEQMSTTDGFEEDHKS
jgi:hypothetical protein